MIIPPHIVRALTSAAMTRGGFTTRSITLFGSSVVASELAKLHELTLPFVTTLETISFFVLMYIVAHREARTSAADVPNSTDELSIDTFVDEIQSQDEQPLQ